MHIAERTVCMATAEIMQIIVSPRDAWILLPPIIRQSEIILSELKIGRQPSYPDTVTHLKNSHLLEKLLSVFSF